MPSPASDPCRDAFRDLYDRCAPRLRSYVLARFPRLADDVEQETWVRAFRRMCEKRQDVTLPWLFTVARNLAVDEHRRPGHALPDDLDPAAPGVVPLEQMLDSERRAIMKACFAELAAQNPGYEAVVRAVLAAEPVVEAAERLGITRANFDQRKNRSLKILQDCVQRHLP